MAKLASAKYLGILMYPEQLVEEVRRRWERIPSIPELSVFWVTLSGDRDEFASDLRQARGEWPLVPVILRTPGMFRDPNAVMNDVTSILHDAKDEIMDLADCARQCNGLGLVVLSRSELRLTVTSSPLRLPGWFPVMAGKDVASRIDDLTWSVHVPLSDRVVAENDLQRILYNCDQALMVRIQETLKTDHRQVQALWDRIKRQDENDLVLVLQGIDKTLGDIRNPTDFRPSASRNPTMVGRLWFEANRSSPDQLPRVAKALARALRADQLDIGNDVTTLMAVLNRPTQPIGDRGIRWSFHLIVTLRNACQLVTAAAHADQYPIFPDMLLRATSLDLRRFLDEAILVLGSC